MRKVDIFPYYRQCSMELANRYDIIQSLFTGDYINELCAVRGYVGKEQKDLLTEMNIGYCEIEDVELLGNMRKDLGLVSSKDNFILNGRFIIPVYDIAGELTSLIGYFPDKKKIYNNIVTIF